VFVERTIAKNVLAGLRPETAADAIESAPGSLFSPRG
jgi:hypothetical protein